MDAEEETSEAVVVAALAIRVVVVDEAALVVVAAEELDPIKVLALFPCTARNKSFIYRFNPFSSLFSEKMELRRFINFFVRGITMSVNS